MFETEQDYIKLLSDIKRNLECKLELKNYQYNRTLQKEYPVCLLGGEIELHCNHYTSMEEVESKWYKRVERINYDYKICFVPFECDLKSSCTIHLKNNSAIRNMDFWQIINKTADGSLKEYNMVKL